MHMFGKKKDYGPPPKKVQCPDCKGNGKRKEPDPHANRLREIICGRCSGAREVYI